MHQVIGSKFLFVNKLWDFVITKGWPGIFIILVYFLKVFEPFFEKFQMENVLYFWDVFFKSKEYWDGFVGDLNSPQYAKYGSGKDQIKQNGNLLMEEFDLTQFDGFLKKQKLDMIDFKLISEQME